MNILIIKTGALGDVVRTSFIAQALQDKYLKDNPKIYWLTDKKATSFFINNPYVYKVFDKDSRENLRNNFYDLIINLEEDEENCKFVNSLKCRKIIGFLLSGDKIVATESAREWYNMSALGEKPMNDILKKKNKKTHRQIIGEIVGVDWKKYEPFLRLTVEQRKFAREFLRRYNLNRKELIIGINTGAADRWPKSLSVEKTVKLIDDIYRKYKARILLFGGPNEVERNKNIISMCKSPVIDTGCGNDLIEFPALVSACNLFITSDSLGLHISLALKRKTICLIGPTSFSEIDMYGFGIKIAAKSNCLCCYRSDCDSMSKIDLNQILRGVDELLNQKVSIIITSFKEPKTEKAIKQALNQKTKYDYDIIVSAPDKDTLDIARKYSKKNKKVIVVKDPGKGKSYALNFLFEKIKSNIVIITDGDVFMNEFAVEELVNDLSDPEIGCVSGRPVPMEDKKTKYGYWANFLFEAAHRMRTKARNNEEFLECSAYLLAFRRDRLSKIPVDVAEDAYIPYYFWERGYRIGYNDKAKVFVKNVDNWKDWVKQKVRTSKAHETLNKYVNVKITPRAKTFSNESRGINWALDYPRNLKETIWMLELILARGYMWARVLFDTKIRNKHYGDAWERVESAR